MNDYYMLKLPLKVYDMLKDSIQKAKTRLTIEAPLDAQEIVCLLDEALSFLDQAERTQV